MGLSGLGGEDRGSKNEGLDLVLTAWCSGVKEIVQTYGTYVKNASAAYLAKGAKVILSSATPNNVWESGKWSWGPGRFDYYPW